MEKSSAAIPQQSAHRNVEAVPETSLVRGGPFYRAQETIRLLTAKRWNLGRRIFLAICVGWVPLTLLTLFFNPNTIGGLIKDYTVNFRMLVAVPILLAGQVIMDDIFCMILAHIRDAQLLPPPEDAKMDRLLSRLLPLRDSFIAEAIIVVIVYANVAGMIGVRVATAEGWALSGVGTGHHLSPAGWYYALVSQLLYRFLLGISVWKWCLWVFFLFRLSRLNLQLIPTHPDQHGGVGFLGMSPIAIASTVFVMCGAIGSTWRTAILDHQAHLMNFKIDAIVLLVIMLIFATGPLILFVPKLVLLRRQGILQYGTLGQLQSVDFHKKWILNRDGHEDELLAAPEISTLTDYASSYENVQKLQPFPFDRGGMIVLVLVIVIPLLPVVLAEIPFVTVVKGLLSALT